MAWAARWTARTGYILFLGSFKFYDQGRLTGACLVIFPTCYRCQKLVVAGEGIVDGVDAVSEHWSNIRDRMI